MLRNVEANHRLEATQKTARLSRNVMVVSEYGSFEKMEHFPNFMKRQQNMIDPSQQNTNDIEGYYYEAIDGSQMAFWECHSDRESKKHVHDFDEWTIVVSGEYVACFEDKEVVLKAGDELLVPKGTVQWGRCKAGTRTISAFGGRRIASGIMEEKP